MAKTIGDLTELTEFPAADDLLVVRDSSASGVDKHIRRDTLINSAALLDAGSADGEVRTNLENDNRFLQKTNNLSELDDVTTSRDNLGLGSAAILDTGTDPNQIPTNADLYVDSIADLPPVVIGQQIRTTGYHSGSNVGGGVFTGVASARHDGVQFFDPARAFPSDWNIKAQRAAWFNDSGVDALCWKRVFDGDIDPRFSGVLADGSADDYNAWKAVLSFYTRLRQDVPGAGDTNSYTAPAMIGVAGTSLLSEPIGIPSYFTARFGQTKFDRHPEWSEPVGTYLLQSGFLYQADFGGLSFDGVDHCLDIRNANLDQTVISVSNFRISGGTFGINVACQSGFVKITNFKSDKCVQFLTVEDCDKCVLDDGWITQGVISTNADATIEVIQGKLVVGDIVGVPMTHTASECAWVNLLNGYVIFDRFRAGAEPGSCTLINYAADPNVTYPQTEPQGFEINSSEIFSVDTQGGTQTSCIVRLFKIPNIMSIKNDRGMIDTQQIVAWANSADQAGQLAIYKSNRKSFSWNFRDNTQSILAQRIPQNLWRLIRSNVELQIQGDSYAGNTVTCTLGYAPHQDDGDFLVSMVGQVDFASGNGNYRATITGILSQTTYYNGSEVVRRLTFIELSNSPGGGTGADSLTVTPVFWDLSAESAEAPVNDQSYYIRLKVSGFDTGTSAPLLTGVMRPLFI